MKKILTLTLLTLLLVSCGGNQKESSESIIASEDINLIRKQRTKIAAEQTKINEELQSLDNAIARLDTVKRLPLVTTLTAHEKEFKHYLEIQGGVDTKKNIVLYPEFSGLLSKVYTKAGQKVQMKIQANLAKTTFERQERLWNQKIGSEIQYLQAKSNYEAQQKAVQQMQSQVGKTNIRAPFSGIVDDIITEQGTVVSAGQSPIIRLVNLGDMFIEASIPEVYLNYVSKGKNVEVYFPILRETISTSISQVGNYIEPTNRTFKIEIKVPNKNSKIKPNLTAKLKINDYTNKKAILIPQSIISEDAEGKQYVYTAQTIESSGANIAKRTTITTGKTQDDLVEVLSGLQNGNIIIEEGARSVKDGQEIKVLNP